MKRSDFRVSHPAWLRAACCAMAALLGAPVVSASEDPELAALLAMLDEETEIATKTRMNSDFVPGMVTVLDGGKLADEIGLFVRERLRHLARLALARAQSAVPASAPGPD